MTAATLPDAAVHAGSWSGSRHRRRAGMDWPPVAPAVGIVAVAVVLPLLWLVAQSFLGADGLTLAHYRRLVTGTGYLLSLQTTLIVAAAVTASAIVLGYPVAFLIASSSKRRAGLVLMIVLLPLWTS